jgi:hypothetical protein
MPGLWIYRCEFTIKFAFLNLSILPVLWHQSEVWPAFFFHWLETSPDIQVCTDIAPPDEFKQKYLVYLPSI